MKLKKRSDKWIEKKNEKQNTNKEKQKQKQNKTKKNRLKQQHKTISKLRKKKSFKKKNIIPNSSMNGSEHSFSNIINQFKKKKSKMKKWNTKK